MPRPLSNDIRERLIRSVVGGMSRNATAKRYDVSISSVVKLLQRWKASGSYGPLPMGGYRGHKLSDHRTLVEQFVKTKPDTTLAELQGQLKAHKITVSTTSINRFLKHLGLSYKKNGTRQRTR